MAETEILQTDIAGKEGVNGISCAAQKKLDAIVEPWVLLRVLAECDQVENFLLLRRDTREIRFPIAFNAGGV